MVVPAVPQNAAQPHRTEITVPEFKRAVPAVPLNAAPPPRGQFAGKKYRTEITVPEFKPAVPAVPVPQNAAPPPMGPFPGKEYRTGITVPEFKRWVMQFDTDHDGRISRKELREAIRRRGSWFCGLRALFAVWRVDRNRNGFVDNSEIEGLIHFAETELGFRITAE